MVFAGDQRVVYFAEVGAPAADSLDGVAPNREIRTNRKPSGTERFRIVLDGLVAVVDQCKRTPDIPGANREHFSGRRYLPARQHFSEDEHDAVGSTEVRDGSHQPVRAWQDVVVSQRDDVPLRDRQPGIECETLALLPLVHVLHRPGTQRGGATDDGGGIVGRVVIDHDDFYRACSGRTILNSHSRSA